MNKTTIKIIAISLCILSLVGFLFIMKDGDRILEGEFESGDQLTQKTKVKPGKDNVIGPARKSRFQAKSVDDIKEEDLGFTQEELDILAREEALLDQIEEQWNTQIEDFFINELKLPVEKLQEYKQLRENYYKESFELLESLHQDLINEYGEDYDYNPTEEDELINKRLGRNLKSEYGRKLIESLGTEDYKKYLELKDRFNEKLMLKDSGQGTMLIEF